MRKPTKHSIKAKLDKIVSLKTRALGVCQLCGNSDYSHLETSHIFSRKNLATRWDLKNCLCSCDGCHFWSHQNPLLFADKVKTILGDYEYQNLKSKAVSTKKWTLEEMIELYESLKGIE